MKKSINPYTVIDWEELKLIKICGNSYIEETPEKRRISAGCCGIRNI
jgi:hypothetical protein